MSNVVGLNTALTGDPLPDSQLRAGMERLRRARDLAVEGSSSLSAAERAAIAEEIRSVQDELVGIANTRHRGRPLFSGYGAGDAVGRDGAGDTDALNDAINGAITRLDDAQRVMGTTLARVGANHNRVESLLARTQDARLSLRGELAEVEDPDIAEAILELQTQEVAYTATLQALGRALPPSLAAFLR
ncbi:MAG: hypothetical protein H0V93_08930 [Euzebyales bacterium]|jgi:flagellar hook-associated protein 3 FlgL|nr:hypothetical protein [Euzebyales bacterium]